jgi:hypothetical protein
VDLAQWHMWWKRRGARGVRRILLQEWDPIGVRGIPGADDEYDSYVGRVGRMLREQAGAEAIASFLAETRIETMGLPARDTQDRSVSATLLDWYEQEMREHE